MARVIRFFLEQKAVVLLLLIGVALWGAAVAPFDWNIPALPRRPVPVDAIPNLGENQQIVYTTWEGRSPRDVEAQVTYPLTTALLGVPGVREVRSVSMFGASLIFLLFQDDIEIYWARARILEKLNSLPAGLLPPDTTSALGPDATALGQIFWYTLEGRDPDGRPVGGWDLHELRSLQDWTVRYALLAAEGVSEVASIGGHVREYFVEVHPDALRAHGVTLDEVVEAIRASNLDIGAGVTEINRVEYQIRGLGFVRSIADIEQAVVRAGPDGAPIRVRDVAAVGWGPAPRRGALTKMGAEAVGGVVVVREGYNPLKAIQNVKARIEELRPGLPARAVADWSQTDRKTLEAFAAAQGFEAFDGPDLNQERWLSWLRSNPRAAWPKGVTISRLDIVPFYDRTGLIHETLGTLNDALVQQILVTVAVIVLALMHVRTAALISAMLPFSVLLCFILMKAFGIVSNLVSLAGIAIAIGTVVDMGIIVTENVLRRLEEAPPDRPRLDVVYHAVMEVASAVATAISTTVVGFLPVFTMTGAEGKMFVPLAWTKTFALVASVALALFALPAAIHVCIARPASAPDRRRAAWRGLAGGVAVLCGLAFVKGWMAAGAVLAVLSLTILRRLRRNAESVPKAAPPLATTSGFVARFSPWAGRWPAAAAAAGAIWILASVWEPLGPEHGAARNFLFTAGLVGGWMGAFFLLLRAYRRILAWALAHKALFLSLPLFVLLWGGVVWWGFDRLFGIVPAAIERLGGDGDALRRQRFWVWAAHAFPGMGREFMPALDEGSFLWMPTTMPHASLGETLEVMQYQDRAIASVPEVEMVVGKLGRVESALDPAPITMIETLIRYKPEYRLDASGRRQRFRYNRRAGEFARDERGELIPDPRGRPYRQWRDHIRTPQDIWDEIVKSARLPGATSAPKLQPIETRLVMLQTGMRAAMGIKLRAPDIETLDRAAIELERHVRQAPGVRAETVNAERVVGAAYLEMEIDRAAIARFGLRIRDVQDALAAAVGGVVATTTVEGRERYAVRVRYPRELRQDVEALERILVATPTGAQIPLGDLARIAYARGPQMIRSEDTFPTAYITFGGEPGRAEVDIVEGVRAYLQARIARGELKLPSGVFWRFAGAYEHQLRAMAALRIVLPLALGVIFLLLYFQFRKISLTLVVFSGIALAWAGGFVMMDLLGRSWFLDFSVFGVPLRELFHFGRVNLSVAVWVGFLALFGIAVDDGVVLATYIAQRFSEAPPRNAEDVRNRVIEAGRRRIRPCMMTSATTLLALLPVLTSNGRGADLLRPMALPVLGGMTLAILTWFTVPVLASALKERELRRNRSVTI